MAQRLLHYFMERGRHLSLLVSLLLYAILYTFLQRIVIGKFLLDILLLFIIISTLVALHNRRFQLWISLAFALPAFGFNWMNYLLEDSPFQVIGMIFTIIFLFHVALNLLIDVFKDEKITLDKISGAICVYLLIGMIWGLLYSFAHLHDPHSFTGTGIESSTENADKLSHQHPPLMYYSFVTLTTLGYGDIIPNSDIARSLAWIEAIIGQIYLTVLVARLVGLHIAQTTSGIQTNRHTDQ